eukprot:1089767-Alexandrium_andersonii.AAC.1
MCIRDRDHGGVFVAKPAESEVPTFHRQDPRVEGEELYGTAVREWLPKLVYEKPDEGLFKHDSALFDPNLCSAEPPK